MWVIYPQYKRESRKDDKFCIVDTRSSVSDIANWAQLVPMEFVEKHTLSLRSFRKHRNVQWIYGSLFHALCACASTYNCIGLEFVHKLTNDTILENGKPWSACVSKIGRTRSIVIRFFLISFYPRWSYVSPAFKYRTAGPPFSAFLRYSFSKYEMRAKPP